MLLDPLYWKQIQARRIYTDFVEEEQNKLKISLATRVKFAAGRLYPRSSNDIDSEHW